MFLDELPCGPAYHRVAAAFAWSSAFSRAKK